MLDFKVSFGFRWADLFLLLVQLMESELHRHYFFAFEFKVLENS
jgi:hypothetical protein